MLQWRVQRACSRFVQRELLVWRCMRQLVQCRLVSDFGSRAKRNRCRKVVAIRNTRRDLGLGIAIVAHERGIPSKRNSSYCVDYVPALCTHRPSLLPIEWLGEAFGLAQGGRQRPPRAGKLVKLRHLEEVKVVTRFP